MNVAANSDRRRGRGAGLARAGMLALALAGLALLAPNRGTGHGGEHSFMGLDFGASADGVSLTSENSLDAAGQARITELCDNLSVVKNARGETVLPAFTATERVEVVNGELHVYLLLPVDRAAGSITEGRLETAVELLRLTFGEQLRLRGYWLHARERLDEKYRLLGDYLPQVPAADAAAGALDYEIGGPGPQPSPDYQALYRAAMEQTKTPQTAGANGYGPIGTSGDPTGVLAGRTVFISPGHGWTYTSSAGWYLQRGRLLSMNEDYGNLDQMNFLAAYCFNAGATVVPCRPLGYQKNEVVLDNTAASGVTFTGTWSNSTNPIYWGAAADAVHYRFATSAATETASAQYTPNIPAAGFYPVYTWVNTGTDRILQLYRIRHAGGEHRIRVNHRRVGRGWVWLGNYYFEAGSNPGTGSVIVSNEGLPGVTTGVVIADAIRFGNGIGNINRGGGLSGYEKEAEAAVYWAEASLGQGISRSSLFTSTADDSADIGVRPRLAAVMRADDGQGYNGDIFFSFHSNAAGCAATPCTARGCTGLYTTATTVTNQQRFAELLSTTLKADATAETAGWDVPFNSNRASDFAGGAYGEIGSGLGGEMCGSLLEIAFHDNTNDSLLLRDPKFRAIAARAVMKAIVKYFNEFDGGTLAYPPESPVRLSATHDGAGNVVLNWAAGPSGGTNGGAATGYRVYRTSHATGTAFDAGVTVPGGATSYTVSGLTPGTLYYFRVTATNAAGESMPTETAGVRAVATGKPTILVVNGYDRLDRTNDPIEFPNASADARIDRMKPNVNNSGAYVVQHGRAIAIAGRSFDYASNEAIEAGTVNLTDYLMVDWISGEESTFDRSFSEGEIAKVKAYLVAGGRFFASGAEIAYDLTNRAGTGTVNVDFLRNDLKAALAKDSAAVYSASAPGTGPFAGLANLTFDNGTGGTYNVNSADAFTVQSGATAALHYGTTGSGDVAAVAFDGPYKLILMGIPFETIQTETARGNVMTKVLAFMGLISSGPTATPTVSPTPSISPTVSPSPTISLTPTLTPTSSPTPSASPTPTPPTQALVENFEASAAGTTVMFRAPAFSGSTTGLVVGSDSTGTVNTERNDILDPAVGSLGTLSDRVQWTWAAAGTGQVRITTSGTAVRPNPLVSLQRGVSVYLKVAQGDLDVALWIRETGVAGAIGSNGTTTGGIEALPSRRIGASNSWQYVYFDIPNEPLTAVAGATANGVRDTDWGTIEALVFRAVPESGATTVDVYIDDIYNGVVHSPLGGSTPVPTLTPTPSATPTETASATPTESPSTTPSATPSGTASLTPTASVSPSVTASISPSPSATPSPTGSATPTASVSPSGSPSATPTMSPSPSPTLPVAADIDGDGYADDYETTVGTNPADPTSVPLLGDVNDDGRVNMQDPLELYRRLRAGEPIPDDMCQRADVNRNEGCTAEDAILLYRWLLAVPGYTVMPFGATP